MVLDLGYQQNHLGGFKILVPGSHPQRVWFKWFGRHWVAKPELQVEFPATHSKVPLAGCLTAVTHTFQQRGGMGQGWEGGSRGRGHMADSPRCVAETNTL